VHDFSTCGGSSFSPARGVCALGLAWALAACMGHVTGGEEANFDAATKGASDAGGPSDSGVATDSGLPDGGTTARDSGSTTTTTGVIPADWQIDWSQAGVLKPDSTLGIPDRSSGTRCASLTPANTLTDINNALATCSSTAAVTNQNQEVFLAAGTYVLSDEVLLSNTRNLTLRGAGRDADAGATVLKFTGSSGGVHLIGSNGSDIIFNPINPSQLYDWNAGYAQGTTVITLGSTTGLSVGDILLLDQLNDDDGPDASVPESMVDVSTNYTANGGTETSRSSGTRAQQQYVRIAAIDSTTGQVTISPGLYMPTWRPSQVPQAYDWNDWSQMSGVEDLILLNAGSASTNLEFNNCYNCWARNIESDNSLNSHVLSWETARVEIRDSYFFQTQTAGGDSRGLFMQTSTDDLIVNNAFEQVTLPISMWGTEGAVIAYNFTTDMTYNTYPQILMPGLTTESGHSSLNLFEGNYSNQISMDNNHGGGSRNTVFRNRLVGWETGRTSSTLAVILNVMNHYEAFVGNVLGKAGVQTVYETSYGNNATPDVSIYGLGYWIYTWDYPSQYDDRVVTTLLREGNFDYQSNSVQWDAGAAVPLPASLYTSAPPSWWGNCPWPPFDPNQAASSDNYLNLPAGVAWHAMFPSKTPSEVGP
jgi:hypothetical protein